MGKHQGWAQPLTGMLPNGVSPSEGPSYVISLDLERWSIAEDKTADLIAFIQPNQPSEIRRNAVADYVKRLIMQCFPCQVFNFGSVPLKTYLPDGDIDLSAFSENPTVKENWAQQVKEMLESEEKNENAEFRVKEVQYIKAEVKIIKCLVENIVVDISFNQLGGLCTLCFLEEVDHLIGKDHLFKRSIILIKAWCYYESRILGAHHGLISTYALETLVLYIFNVYDKDFLGPLEVLYRFLEFFSKFDWENFCVSLRGPVRISSLPEVAVEPPRNDDKELLLNEKFLDACTAVYGVTFDSQENQGTPFASKHFNVIDPLRVNNNLGRSVSRGNFFRIRSAFALGAKKIARLLDCPKEDLHYEVNGFFMNTWNRHGSGHRPDAPRNDLLRSRLSNRESFHGHENQQSSNSKRVEVYLNRVSRAEGNRGSHGSSTPHLDSVSRDSNPSSVSRAQGQKSYGNSSNSRTSNTTLRQESNSKQGQGGIVDKEQTFSRVENTNTIQGRYLFARTHSSPELTESYSEASSQGRRSRAPELTGKNQSATARLDNNPRRNNTEFVSSEEYSISRQQTAADSKSVSNSYPDDGARLSVVSEEFESVSGTQGMIHPEEIMNMSVSSSQAQGYHKQIHLPLNFNSPHLPMNLVSMGYAQRNMAGMMPMMEPWGPNMAFPHGLVSSQARAHYFPGVNMAPNPEDSVDAVEQNLGSNSVEGEHDLWQEQEQGSARESDLDNGNIVSTSSSRNYNASSSRVVRSSGYRGHQRSRVPANREEQADAFDYQGGRENEAYLDDRSPSSRSVRSTHSSPFRSKTSSESSWDGSTSKALKPTRERKGRRGGSAAVQTVSEHSSAPADEDWNSASTIGTEIIERNPGPQSVQMPGFEPVQSSGSESMMPFGPVLIGPGSRQRLGDVIFYPTGPPVPFVAMLPFYNFPREGSGSEASTSQFGGEDGTDSLHNFDSSTSRVENLEELSASSSIAPVETLELKPDILNSDFISHWHNLQYGRLCQTTRFPAPPPPMIYPSPNVLSPVYMPGGQLPWDSPRRPPPPNVNIFNHLVSNGPRLVPVAPVQPVSNGPASVYHVDEMPRFRGGTGTYLPNPKVTPRERQNRRGSYSYDRTDHHNERDGNWNVGVKSRASGRGHGRNQQPEKTIPPIEHQIASESQSNRKWSSSYRQGSSFQHHHHHHQNNSMQQMNLIEGGGGNNNLAYGMYPVMNPSSSISSSNGPPVPPVFMFYPYDRSSHGYVPSSEQQLEMGPGESSKLVVEELHRSSSPDQPSSPQQRR